jgi:hypothetical protein
MITVLYQMMLGAFRFVPINPLAMWVRTKNWSMSGGQSMSKIMLGGNQFGNYPVQHVGEYSTKLTRELISKIESATDEATLHQFGACRLETADRSRVAGVKNYPLSSGRLGRLHRQQRPCVGQYH